MKTHMFKSKHTNTMFKVECNSNNDLFHKSLVSMKYEDITCENCKRTKAYKKLRKAHIKQLSEEMIEDIEGDYTIDKSVGMPEPQTYKQKVEIEIDVPVGMEVDKTTFGIENWKEGTEARIHFKPKVKTGSELVGCLCGVSGVSYDDAKKKAENFERLEVICRYSDEHYFRYSDGIHGSRYAYPVPLEKLKQLQEELER